MAAQEAGDVLSAALVLLSHWLQDSCLHLNTKKNCTAKYVFIFIFCTSQQRAQVFMCIHAVFLKYFSVVFHSNLTNLRQYVLTANVIKSKLANFHHILSFSYFTGSKCFN